MSDFFACGLAAKSQAGLKGSVQLSLGVQRKANSDCAPDEGANYRNRARTANAARAIPAEADCGQYNGSSAGLRQDDRGTLSSHHQPSRSDGQPNEVPYSRVE